MGALSSARLSIFTDVRGGQLRYLLRNCHIASMEMMQVKL